MKYTYATKMILVTRLIFSRDLKMNSVKNLTFLTNMNTMFMYRLEFEF